MDEHHERQARLEQEVLDAHADYQRVYFRLLTELRAAARWRVEASEAPEAPGIQEAGRAIRRRLRTVQRDARRVYVRLLRAKADLLESMYSLDAFGGTEVPDFLPEEL